MLRETKWEQLAHKTAEMLKTATPAEIYAAQDDTNSPKPAQLGATRQQGPRYSRGRRQRKQRKRILPRKPTIQHPKEPGAESKEGEHKIPNQLLANEQPMFTLRAPGTQNGEL